MIDKSIVATFCLTCALLTAFGQDKGVFKLNKLPHQDTLVTGWLFHAGDDKAWATPQFNDVNWPAVDPSTDITDFKQFKNAGIAWIRLHIKTTANLTSQQLVARVTQYSASAIYLDGKLIRQFGTINSDTRTTQAWTIRGNSFALNINDGHEHLLAVRLGYQSGIPYISPWYESLPAFQLYLNSLAGATAITDSYQRLLNKFSTIFAVLIGMFFIIGVTSLIAYLFDKARRVNLYYALYAISFLFATVLSLPIMTDFPATSWQMWCTFAVAVTWAISNLFLLLTVYALFQYPRRQVFTLLLVLSIAGVVWLFWSDVTAYIFCTSILADLCLLEGIRICIWAIKQNKKDGTLVLVGMALYLVLTTWQLSIDQWSIFALLINCISFLSFPVGMAFYLGAQTALTNKKLRISLDEVQQLSEQNLAVEHEKQTILANQNEKLEEQVAVRTVELKHSLEELKATQQQLIQSEKMASLGELTAGIAHEIQNPLNFVNNFSEVSSELMEELKEELHKGDIEEAKFIAADVIANLIKINHHGKRADGIVKGMLEHSRTSTGQKESTDLNKLAGEYLHLAYHGLRAKDKSFNAELITNFDQSLPPVNAIQQDIGRVLLNLFNNAFYAVRQKQKTAGDNYKPAVTVTTAVPPSGGQRVVLSVTDNGTGIADEIKDKILQPFFTTKPTGEGTGLGLSLSYDIIVKGHGGSIDIQSKEGEGSEFIIKLPL